MKEDQPKSSEMENQENKKGKTLREMPKQRIIATIIVVLVTFVIIGICYSAVKSWTAPEEETTASADAALGSEEDKTTKEVEATAVKTMKITNKSIKSGFSAQGRLRAYDKTDIVAEVQGMMKKTDKRFKIGTRYAKDEIMVDIDNTEARLALKSQKAQLHTAITAMMPDMKIDMPGSFNNWKSYLDKLDANRPVREFPKPLSDREEYYVSTKNLHSQYYNIKSAEVRLNKYQVKAPFDGVLTTANVNEGGFVRAGTPLGNLMNTAVFEMEAAVQVADLKYIKRGSTVKVVSDDSGKSWNGKVKRIGDTVDAATQTATVYIGVTGTSLREGQYLRAIINTSAITKAAEIPRELLVDNDKLYIVNDGTLELKTVEIAKMEGNMAIVKGMADGTTILNENIKDAYEGMKIK